MKKFLSMVMAAAMVVSLVPATAFAASGDVKATAKVVDAANFPVDGIKADEDTLAEKGKYPELQLTLTTSDIAYKGATVEFTVTLDNAKFEDSFGNADVYLSDTFTGVSVAAEKTDDEDENEAKVTLTIAEGSKIDRGTVLGIALNKVTMDKVSKGKTATVSVDSDDATITNGDDLVFASIEASSIKASVKDTVDVATEEIATLKDVKIETGVGDFDDFVSKTGKDELKLKLNSGFEFVVTDDSSDDSKDTKIEGVLIKDGQNDIVVDGDEIIIPVSALDSKLNQDTWTIKNLGVEAVSAKTDAVATVRVYLTGCDTVSVEVAKVVDYAVSMTVDEDEDVPVIYSGVDVENTGITDDSDHMSLEVTLKETFPGAWNNSKDFTLELPEGVYVADYMKPNDGVDASNDGDKGPADVDSWFVEAYDEGDYTSFTFKRRTWDETVPQKDDEIEINFSLQLVADPNFEGDVVLKLTGDAVEEQEVTIAKFVKPFVVEAQQNDMQIDYRNTEIPTSVVIKEAEAGLWDKGLEFRLGLDKISFDDEGKITVDDKSGLEIKDNEIKTTDKNLDNDQLYFLIDSRSDDEAATVTISGMELYMQRSLPAGAYDLDVYSPTMLWAKDVEKADGYLAQPVLGFKDKTDAKKAEGTYTKYEKDIEDINDDFYDNTAKAGFVNIITAGREDTDSFTTKVVVPVGESYLISGENKVEIPVPAYINAAGYTMLPLRAVAVALGINENNVLWDQSSRTATVMYGSKIINMTLGQKVVYVNGAMIPATAAVEITNDRMFLGLRDLGTALGVTDITWDGATKTATLNGNK
ncbi:copper amine oxidase N-terminal domain-containing protein [Anaerotignum lactatifermentans]